MGMSVKLLNSAINIPQLSFVFNDCIDAAIFLDNRCVGFRMRLGGWAFSIPFYLVPYHGKAIVVNGS